MDVLLFVVVISGMSDCFEMVIEVVCFVVKYMILVIFLIDGYIVNVVEFWLILDMNEFKKFLVNFVVLGV